MKKIVSQLWVAMILVLLSIESLASVPVVNQYRIEKRPIATEPASNQYSVSAADTAKMQKPPFVYYTELNQLDKTKLYSIPPYPNADQLPAIGKWMLAIAKDQKKLAYVPSHWLDDKSADGQYIIEPINYVFVVFEDHATQAIKVLKSTLEKTGFTTKWSGAKYHSGNYHAYMNDSLLSQLKREDGVFLTFSNNDWLKQNDHFRVMGPYKTTINDKTAYLFASSVSEESDWNQKLYAGHFYVSFSHARGNLAEGLIETGQPTYYVNADNILHTVGESTEDHDGKIFVTVINAPVTKNE